MTADPIPVAVVGTGNMGSNHVRVYDELPGAELVEIVEPDTERARDIVERYDVEVAQHVDGIERAEAATIAAPNEHHEELAKALLARGVDLLVEKPLAPTVEAAREIVAAADAADAILQVGHIERFNPAVETLAEILEEETVIAIEAHRLGPFNEQLSDVNVVLDLMIHDLDVIEALVEGELEHLDAVGRRFRSDELDHAIATMQFDDGVVASAVASHVTHGKIRRLDVTTADSFVTLDYQQQNLTVQRRGVEELTSLSTSAGYRTETVTERPYIQTREPLKIQLEHFLGCVRQRSRPRVTGADGVRAVRRAVDVVNRA